MAYNKGKTGNTPLRISNNITIGLEISTYSTK